MPLTNPASPFFNNYLTGLNITWASTTTFTVALGQAADAANAYAMTLGSAITKSTSAWAVGSGNGGLDTGAIAAGSWYNVFLIRRPDTGVVDVLFSLSASAPTMPTNYTQKRRIASISTNGSSQFVKYFQDGDYFAWDAPTADVSASNPGTAAVTRSISVPLGLRVRAHLFVAADCTSAGAPGGVYISDLSATDSAASSSKARVYSYVATIVTEYLFGAEVQVMTDTSSQVRSRIQVSDANTTLFISTLGWFDARGK